MDVTTLPPPRPPAAVPPQAPEAAVPQRASVTPPETTRPVEATEPPVDPAPIKGLGIPPLDTAQVGDNDDIPKPPEPPREAIVAARIEVEVEPRAVEASAEATNVDTASDTQSAGSETGPEPEPAQVPSPEASRAAEAFPEALRDIYEGPANPTVDLRR